ncbi:MAG: MotA/TolQ/ExbB proton channel family protein [Prevotellaceae bacterium]|jgi:biopolymer transport protein ExbB|nr:MotA/TolQ/ExbB proton channel family protein [Prevotellaceae bacterium]
MATNFILLQAVEQQQLDFIELAIKGGWVMIPILILSFIAVFIIVERFLAIRRASKVDNHFMSNIREYILNNRTDAAIALCQASAIPQARLIEKGIKRIGAPLNDIQTAIENEGNLEVARLEKGLAILAMIAGGAPMLGFLGTVTGMVRAFFNMANAGNNLDIQILSSGIYEAMVTTIAGLIVGLVAFFGYNLLVAQVQRVVFHLEASTMEFMDMLYAKK